MSLTRCIFHLLSFKLLHLERLLLVVASVFNFVLYLGPLKKSALWKYRRNSVLVFLNVFLKATQLYLTWVIQASSRDRLSSTQMLLILKNYIGRFAQRTYVPKDCGVVLSLPYRLA